jgi:methylenetetrahydrofolate reductase (NADPH)
MRIDRQLEGPEPSFSVELFPPKDEQARQAMLETVEELAVLQPDFFSVTYGAVGATRDGTLETVTTIKRDLGFDAMAHLSCVGESTEGLRTILDRLDEAGIENVLALRGDPPRGEGEFEPVEGGLSGSAELAELISTQYPQIAIGASCFPEVHPEAASLDEDLAYLRVKVDSGASFLITQLFFDNDLYFDFVSAARKAGIEVPIIPGLMPISSYSAIERMAGLCKASIPDPLRESMLALGGDTEAEAELGVAYASQQATDLMRRGAPGIHFYSLNRSYATRSILASLRASRPWEHAEGDLAAEVS